MNLLNGQAGVLVVEVEFGKTSLTEQCWDSYSHSLLKLSLEHMSVLTHGEILNFFRGLGDLCGWKSSSLTFLVTPRMTPRWRSMLFEV